MHSDPVPFKFSVVELYQGCGKFFITMYNTKLGTIKTLLWSLVLQEMHGSILIAMSCISIPIGSPILEHACAFNYNDVFRA